MKVVVYLIAGIALLGGLFLWFRPGPEGSPPVPDRVASSPPAPARPQAVPPVEPGATVPEQPSAAPAVELVIARGRLTSGPSIVRVKQNDPVVFHVTSDVADELHLHGYNLRLALKPGKTATLEVRTTRVGRFPYELHHLDLELGALEVYPR